LATLPRFVEFANTAVAPDAIIKLLAAFREPITVRVPFVTLVAPPYVFAPASVVVPLNSTLPDPEITPLEVPPATFTVAPVSTMIEPPPSVEMLVVPPATFTVPAVMLEIVPPLARLRVPPEMVFVTEVNPPLAFTIPDVMVEMFPPLVRVNVPPATVPTLMPLARVKLPDESVSTVEAPLMLNVPEPKLVTSTWPEMLPDAVKVPIFAPLPEKRVSPVPDRESS